LNYIIAGDRTTDKGNGNEDDDPPSHHVAYEQINKLLRGTIALYTYRVALMQGHLSLQKLAISFAYCDPFRDEARYFMATDGSANDIEDTSFFGRICARTQSPYPSTDSSIDSGALRGADVSRMSVGRTGRSIRPRVSGTAVGAVYQIGVCGFLGRFHSQTDQSPDPQTKC